MSSKIDRGYKLDDDPQFMFWTKKKKKNMYTPVNLSFAI